MGIPELSINPLAQRLVGVRQGQGSSCRAAAAATAFGSTAEAVQKHLQQLQ